MKTPRSGASFARWPAGSAVSRASTFIASSSTPSSQAYQPTGDSGTATPKPGSWAQALAKVDITSAFPQAPGRPALSAFVENVVVYIDKIDSRSPGQGLCRDRCSAPAYCRATGAVLLAPQSEGVTARGAASLHISGSRLRRNSRAWTVGRQSRWRREGVRGVGVSICDSSGRG